MESHTLSNILIEKIFRMNRTVIVALSVVVCFSCGKQHSKKYLKAEGFTQGTTFSIVYADSLNRDFSSSFDSIFTIIDNSLSIYNDSSVISQVNRNSRLDVDSMLAQVIAISDLVYRETEGAFDITVGPVVRAIGFGPDKVKGIDTLKVKSLLPLIGMSHLHLNGLTLTKSNPAIQIDVNAVAQGYTVDVVANFLKSKGVVDYIVEVGGEISANGVNSRGTAWVVGVDKPVENALPGENIQTKIYLTNGKGLATSGNYRKFIEVNGSKYSHTINPKTGFPVLNSLLSATVTAPTGAHADALATAFMVKGLEWSTNYINTHPGIDAYFIYSDSSGVYNVWISDGIKLKQDE